MRYLAILLVLAGAAWLVLGQRPDAPKGPVTGQAAMVDYGADWCPPCRQMVPVLAALKAEYAGRASILFVDVDKHGEQAARYGVTGIPVQIFYDKDGAERFRHVGFLAKEDCARILDGLIGP